MNHDEAIEFLISEFKDLERIIKVVMTERTDRRMFEEDVCCDYCNMEIWGPGIHSGYEEGVNTIGDGFIASGWMHEDITNCDEMIREERDNAQFQDGSRNAWGSPPSPPPNVPSGYRFKDR